MISSSKKNYKLFPPNLNYEIEGKYTKLKPIEKDHITDQYVSWLNDKNINRFLSTNNKKQTIKSIIEYINNLRNKDNCEVFCILSKNTNIHIGNMTITNFNVNNHGAIDFGIMIGNKSAQSMGLGAEVYIILLEFVFKFKEIFRVNAGVASNNVKAYKTLESIGYVKEGVRRLSELMQNGKRYDGIMYGILRDEWNQKRQKFSAITSCIKIVKRQ